MQSVKNHYSKENVNVKQGPRTGNSNPGGKRSAFQDAKAEREPLAREIQAAYGLRTPDDHVEKKLESIRSDVKPRKFAR
jgi:hypothetical protein